MRLEALETLIPDTRIPAAQIIAAAGGTPDEVQGFRQLFGMDSVAMAAAKMPAMIRPVTPMGSSAAMNNGKVASIGNKGFIRSGLFL